MDKEQRKRQLATVLQKVWDMIMYDYTDMVGGEDKVERMSAVDLASTCCDYVGLHHGTRQDLDDLCKLPRKEFRCVAKIAFPKNK